MIRGILTAWHVSGCLQHSPGSTEAALWCTCNHSQTQEAWWLLCILQCPGSAQLQPHLNLGALQQDSCYSVLLIAMQIQHLEPGRQYVARVRAVNACGPSTWCEPCSFTTEPNVPGAPEAPAVSKRSATSLSVKWAAPISDNGAAVTAYRYRWQLVHMCHHNIRRSQLL